MKNARYANEYGEAFDFFEQKTHLLFFEAIENEGKNPLVLILLAFLGPFLPSLASVCSDIIVIPIHNKNNALSFFIVG